MKKMKTQKVVSKEQTEEMVKEKFLKIIKTVKEYAPESTYFEAVYNTKPDGSFFIEFKNDYWNDNCKPVCYAEKFEH